MPARTQSGAKTRTTCGRDWDGVRPDRGPRRSGGCCSGVAQVLSWWLSGGRARVGRRMGRRLGWRRFGVLETPPQTHPKMPVTAATALVSAPWRLNPVGSRDPDILRMSVGGEIQRRKVVRKRLGRALRGRSAAAGPVPAPALVAALVAARVRAGGPVGGWGSPPGRC